MKSKPALFLAFGSNLAWLVVVAVLLFQRKPESTEPGPALSASPVPPAAPALANESSDPNPAPADKPFRWSQLESTNYMAYVANLRAIGCPERILAEIVTADVDSVYAPKRQQLEDQERLLAADSQTERPASREALAAERQKLLQEETDLIARLLGQTPAPAGPQLAATSASAASPPAKPSLPVVFAQVDTNTLNLTPRQQALIDGLRRGFTSQLGNLDPNSPEYAESWQKSQPEVDRILRQQLGYQVYNQLQMQARRKTSDPQPAH